MNVNIKNVLMVCKKSAYKAYFSKDDVKNAFRISPKDQERFKKTHDRHYRSIDEIEDVLREHQIRYKKVSRTRKVDFQKYDLIITTGGDGTFLDAARNTSDQLILGVNSDPNWSVGRFCTADHDSFEKVFKRIMSGKQKIVPLRRLELSLKGLPAPIPFLNDILVCQKNPAAMSRYYIKVGAVREEHRSSGVWVATAAGSTGAINSAGGKIMPLTVSDYQYRVRELYYVSGIQSKLKGGILKSNNTIKITSMMKDGVIYIDGANVKIPFPFGVELTVKMTKKPLRVVQ